MEEGIISFAIAQWQQHPLDEFAGYGTLEQWRRILQQKHLIGRDTQGISYGNVSLRHPQGGFVITSSQQAHLPHLAPDQYTWVTHYDWEAHTLCCVGTFPPSSESGTHHTLYQVHPALGAVLHVHNSGLWHYLLGQGWHTDPAIAYGTAAMAVNVAQLYGAIADPFTRPVLAMGGHQDGILSFGATVDDAGTALMEVLPLAYSS
jgi:hypothetical protein